MTTDSTGYSEGSQSVTVLVLGILGLVVCQVLAPFAWYLGNQEITAIDAGRRPPENRGMAVAGRVLGIIGTVLLGVALLIVAVVVIIAIVAAVGQT